MALNPRVPFDSAVTGTGDAVVPDPLGGAYNVGDLIILIVETANEPTTLSVPNGFVEETAYRFGTGTPGAANAIGIQVFWKFATSGTNGCTVLDSGDHTVAQPYVFDWGGLQTSSSPFATVSREAYSSGSTLHSPAHTTRQNNESIIAIFANAVSSTSEQISSEDNLSLSGGTSWSFGQTTSGVGGGFDTANGVKTTAGTFAADTWTGTMAGATPLVVVQIGILDSTSPPTQGLHPTLTVTPATFGGTSGGVEMIYDIPQTPISVAIGGFDVDMVLGGGDIRVLGWFDEDMIAEASAVTDVNVDADIAEVTSTALGATALAGAVTGQAALATITAAALAAGDTPGSATVATAIAAISTVALAPSSAAGPVSPAADIAEATTAALAATASSANVAAADAADVTSVALGAAASAGAVTVQTPVAFTSGPGGHNIIALAATPAAGAVSVAADVAEAELEALGASVSLVVDADIAFVICVAEDATASSSEASTPAPSGMARRRRMAPFKPPELRPFKNRERRTVAAELAPLRIVAMPATAKSDARARARYAELFSVPISARAIVSPVMVEADRALLIVLPLSAAAAGDIAVEADIATIVMIPAAATAQLEIAAESALLALVALPAMAYVS